MRSFPSTLIVIGFLTALSGPACTSTAQEGSGEKVYADPAEAKQTRSFSIQGEYTGVLDEGGSPGEKIGVQVIALGDGDFRAVSYRGGLPGDGWSADADDREEIQGRLEDGAVAFEHENYTSIVENGVMTARLEDGTEIGTLEKVHRESPTLGQEPPEGATVLFDGTGESLQHWKDGAGITDDGLLKQGASTREAFGDHAIHVEFRLPFKPHARGQDRGNSGIYLLGRYEVQMLDSFGLEGKDNECGGLYTTKAPDVNMCYPPLAWQTYDIDFTAPRFDDDGEKTRNARITVRHNGVVIHDDVELPHGTGGQADNPEHPRGPINLQDHGNPVRYRNIWIVE